MVSSLELDSFTLLAPYKALLYASGSRGIRQSETDAGNGFHPQMSKAGEIGLASFSHFNRIQWIDASAFAIHKPFFGWGWLLLPRSLSVK